MAKEKCLCDQCPRRFVCFTQKKVFSDPAYQAMYEAYIEEGLEHGGAVKKVREFIERQKIPTSNGWWKERSAANIPEFLDYDDWKKYDDKCNIGTMQVDEAKEVIDNIKYETKELMKKYEKSTKSEM